MMAVQLNLSRLIHWLKCSMLISVITTSSSVRICLGICVTFNGKSDESSGTGGSMRLMLASLRAWAALATSCQLDFVMMVEAVAISTTDVPAGPNA